MEKHVDDLIFKDEVYEIIGAAIDVHKELGSGFLESIYEECFGYELNERGIPFETQIQLNVVYKGKKLEKKYIADLIIDGKILVEIKCVSKLTKVFEAQVINYLKATKLKIGLLINFGSEGLLEWKRMVY